MMSSITWEKLQVKEKVSVFAVAILLVVYVFYDFVLTPEWAHIDDLTAQYNTERQKVKVIEDFVLAHPNPELHVVELDNKLMQVGRMLPDNPDMSHFLVQIEQLAQENGVQLGSLKPTKTANKEGYREFEVEFTVKGSFAQVMNFLHKTENGIRFINITNITMQVNKEGLTSKLSAKIYSYGVPAAPPAANAKPAETKK